MQININNKELNELLKFQEGGTMPPEGGVPAEAPAAAPEEGGSPEEQIIQAAMQAVQTQDAQLALQVCQALVEMSGAGAPAEPAAPEGQAPVYKKGGKLSRWISK